MLSKFTIHVSHFNFLLTYTFVKIFSCDSKHLKVYPTVLHTRVSNGTGQYNFSGQRDRSFFIVPGERDSQNRDGMRDKTRQSKKRCSKTGNGCSKT